MPARHRTFSSWAKLSVAFWSANSMSMNLRHAAALALVMWYLLIPPNKRQRFDASAPQSKWTVFSAYRTREDCETDQAGWAAVKVEEHYNDAAAELRAGRCVRLPLNDPRLHYAPASK